MSVELVNYLSKSTPSNSVGLNVFYESSTSRGFRCLFDSGASAAFTAGTNGLIPSTIRKLNPPMPVLMGTTTGGANLTGLAPVCFRSSTDKQVGLVGLLRYYSLPDFGKDLNLIPTSAFEHAHWNILTGADFSFMYRDSKEITSNSTAALEIIKGNVNGLNGITDSIEIHRSGGLKALDLNSIERFQTIRDVVTGTKLDKRKLLNDEDYLLKNCSVLLCPNNNKSKQGSHFCLTTTDSMPELVEASESDDDSSDEEHFTNANQSSSSPALSLENAYSTLMGKGDITPIPPEPPPVPILKVCLVGPGLCNESTLIQRGLPIEVTVAIENIKQLEEQRDVMMVNLERNRILLEHYKKIVKER